MSEIQLFFWGINAAIIFVVLFIVLIIALWVVNKWILKGKIRQLNRILISIGIPLMLIGWDYYSTNSSFYSSSNILDSVCSANENWKKRGDEYLFNSLNYEKEFNDSLIVCLNKGTATFVRYMW